MDANINLGPLAGLVGKWRGDTGKDIAPEPDDIERNDYYEEIEFRVVGDVENALEQTLAIVQYELIARRATNGNLLHHQLGYWTWDEQDNSVCNSFTIGRRVSVVAMGEVACSGDGIIFDVEASKSTDCPGICESGFMADKASTQSFTQIMELKGDELRYRQLTIVDIYGQKSFEHRDENVLVRCS